VPEIDGVDLDKRSSGTMFRHRKHLLENATFQNARTMRRPTDGTILSQACFLRGNGLRSRD
jgi:hypothetical protein